MSNKEDCVIGMLVIKREGQIFVVAEKGYGKRSENTQYRNQKRGGKGAFTLKTSKKTGDLISILEVIDNDDLMIITNKGTMIRQSIEKINIIGRNTQGVRLIKLKNNAIIASVTKIISEEEETQPQGEDQ